MLKKSKHRSQTLNTSALNFSRRHLAIGGGALLLAHSSDRFKLISSAAAARNDIGILVGEGDQREWRFCHKCFSMFYNGDPQGRKGLCAAGGAHQPQGFNFVLHYSSERRQPVPGRDSQYEWRYCSKCFGMFFDGGDGLGVCPLVERDREFRDNRHRPYGFIFGLPHDHAANPGQKDWRFCGKCFGLFFDDPKNSYKGKCPGGGVHVRSSNSFNFQLAFVSEWIGAPGAPISPTISVSTSSANSFVVTGSNFVANAPVTIRVADDALKNVYITTIGGRRIAADGNGTLRLTFNGLCQLPGRLHFSATDGRSVPSPVDATGNLWSNTVPVTCG
jgi:hypothetical protein